MLSRPVPVPDDHTKPFWDAARDHVLTAARCTRCGAFAHPPDLTCPHCHSSDPRFEFQPVPGGARVRSWTVVRQSFLPGFDVPFVLVDAELDAQTDLRMIGRLLDGPGAPLALGDRLRVTFEDITPDVSVPAFRLDRSS